MILYVTRKGKKAPTLISRKWAWVRKYKWYLRNDGYVMRDFTIEEVAALKLPRKQVMLHQLITNFAARAAPKLETDHINGCRSDNRENNLRVVSMSENNRAKHNISRRNTTGYTGVYYNKCRRCWEARVFVGDYPISRSSRGWTREDAVECRDFMAKWLYAIPQNKASWSREDAVVLRAELTEHMRLVGRKENSRHARY